MLNIIPQPRDIKVNENEHFIFNSLSVFGSELISKDAFDDFVDFCSKIGVKVTTAQQNEANLLLLKTEGKIAEEYFLEVCDKIFISSCAGNGAFYGLETLKQILLQCGNKIPRTIIKDTPLYDYRGFMLDVGRYFYSVNEVKKFIDMMALHKLNTFHFHLTEDQGWRIEIKKYPLLTQKGSKRSHTNFGVVPHSGFYTQEEIKEIVAYAHAKYIKVIPEFDIPGHTVSAIACYPELSCFNRQLNVKTHWGVKHDIMCAGKEFTYKFVYDVMDELIELFPDKVIHLGGDEAVKMRWDICPHCQKVIEDNNLKDSEELQQLFMSKINAYLQQKGYSTMMWNWDLNSVSNTLDSSIAWNLCGSDENVRPLIHQEMKNGRKMVSTCAHPYYLDLPYGWVNLKNSCDYAPECVLSGDESDVNLIGVEGPLWTEYVPNMKKAEYMTFPRLGAVSTAAWSDKTERNYDKFKAKLDDYYKLLDCYDVQYAKLNQCMPSKIRAKFSGMWFNRRVLHWEGLHNLIDDAMVKSKYSK